MPSPSKRSKTDTLSLRLDPKTKFILDFVARVRGQSITTTVERSIRDAAAEVTVSGVGFEKNWSDFWDANEGVRTLNLLLNTGYPTNYEEDELLSFTKTHWQFFYTNDKASVPRRGYLEIIWPNLTKYLELWKEKRQSNYWAAGEAMVRDLSNAQVAPPADWPPRNKSAGPRESFSADLDDEIPF